MKLGMMIFFTSIGMMGCFIDRGPLLEGVSKQYQCNSNIEDKKTAVECFNAFFGKKIAEITKIRGKIGLTEEILKSYEEVTEDNIFIHNGNYHIQRDGFGSPYFIKESIIYREHG